MGAVDGNDIGKAEGSPCEGAGIAPERVEEDVVEAVEENSLKDEYD